MLQHISTNTLNLLFVTISGCKFPYLKENLAICLFSQPFSMSTEIFCTCHQSSCYVPRAIHQPQSAVSFWHRDCLICRRTSIWSSPSEIYHRLSWKRGCWEWAQKATMCLHCKSELSELSIAFSLFVCFYPMFVSHPADDELTQLILNPELRVVYCTCFL